MQLNVNTSAVIHHTDVLEKLHKSALPSAVRGALNKAAYDVKTDTMPDESKQAFTQRQPNFFKANSKFENAKGFNVKTMQSTVGFVSEKLKGSNNYSVEELEDQEHGGNINKRSFVPLKQARYGFNNKKLVRPNAVLSNIKKIVNTKDMVGKYHKLTDRQKFTMAAIKAGSDGYVLSGRTLWHIAFLMRTGGRTKVYKTAIYSYVPGRSVHINRTGFMQKASLKTAKKIETFYIVEAERQIKKFMK